MDFEYWEIGPTPCNESCAQVGEDNFRDNAKKEMKAYINQLHRLFPDAYDNNVDFVIKWYPHDFGSYGEVCISFISGDTKAEEIAIYIERNLPEDWDMEAKKELELEIK